MILTLLGAMLVAAFIIFGACVVLQAVIDTIKFKTKRKTK